MVTLAEVARHAGVSLATASRALHGTRKVNEELRQRVLLAASTLGYVADTAAQTLASGVGNVIGLIVHDLVDPYFASLADGVMSAADERGLIVTVGATRRDEDRELALVSTLRVQRARAIILAGSRPLAAQPHLRAELDRYVEGGGRVATIGQDRLGVHTVAPANREGAAALARSLYELGHRRFAVLRGPRNVLTAIDRAESFVEALASLDVPPPQLIPGGFHRDGGYEAVKALDPDVTCVFAVNDVMAVGALAALREQGVRVPDDLSVAGFDDIPTLRDLVPALTTVRLPLTLLGTRALELALADSAGPRLEQIPGEVVIRHSTRRLP